MLKGGDFPNQYKLPSIRAAAAKGRGPGVDSELQSNARSNPESEIQENNVLILGQLLDLTLSPEPLGCVVTLLLPKWREHSFAPAGLLTHQHGQRAALQSTSGGNCGGAARICDRSAHRSPVSHFLRSPCSRWTGSAELVQTNISSCTGGRGRAILDVRASR